MSEYQSFLRQKMKAVQLSGFDVEESELNTKLFDFQKFIVKRAIKAGRYAIFADCGLGKTFMQLEWARLVTEHTNQPVLILCPLAVAGQTIKEGERFGIEVQRLKSDVFGRGIFITNYDQLANIDPTQFAGVVLDESSILKNFEGQTKTAIIEAFDGLRFKLACTATPSPNDPMELGNHSEFLGVMKRNEMLAMYFIHDGGDTAKWRLKGHAVKLFYQWVATWAVMLAKPSDIGFSAEGYDLPELRMIDKTIITPKRNNGQLFNDTAVSATDFNAELRITKVERLDEVAKIVNASSYPFIIWIKQDEEGESLRKMIPDAVEVKGSDKPETKESRLLGFGRGEFRVLITKTKIAQFGLNYQHCRNQVFASLDFSFEGLYQAIRRSYRFGQTEAVNIFIITTDTMQNVVQSIHNKQMQFKTMQAEMTDAVCKHLAEKTIKMSEIVGSEKTEKYSIFCGDSFKLIETLEDGSIGASFFSPPFSSLYTYSDKVDDLSNCTSHDEFYRHFTFMIPELYRVMQSGRMIGMHVTQLTTGIARDGFFSVIDFRGEIIRMFQEHGFIFHGEVTIWKDPELAAIRTKNHQLLHKSTKRDSCIVRPGLADYLIIMRKPGVNAHPINHDGNGIPFERWCKIASPVWMDISESDTLQFRNAREDEDERHITPTQIEVVKNFLTLYSNPNDVVFDPFLGIGTTAYQAVKMGRKAIGFELKESYFDIAKQNVRAAEAMTLQATLF